MFLNTIKVPPGASNTLAGSIIARQDRIPVWAMSRLFLIILGAGFLFILYDIFDINVSFIQTCTQIIPGCTPATAGSYLGKAVLFNLSGYVLGELFFSPLADKVGRKDMLAFTIMITTIGAFYTAIANDYTNFIIGRIITGIGVGADLAIVNTYICEVAPIRSRAKYVSLLFIPASFGGLLGVWLGLLLTTPPTPFPLGLPFALAGPHFSIGWRIMYLIGAAMAGIGVLTRVQLPESPRWLVSKGRLADAAFIVGQMEARASLSVKLSPPSTVLPASTAATKTSYVYLFSDAIYLKRSIIILSVWVLGMIGLYSMAAGLTVLLAGLHFAPEEAGLIAAIGVLGFPICGVITYIFGERVERKYWLLIAAALVLPSGVITALNQNNFSIACLGAIVFFIGMNIWVPMCWTWSAENFPTRARVTGFALVEGVGHIGGGIGVVSITSAIFKLGPFYTFLLLGALLLTAACLALFGIATRGKRLDDVSP